MNADANGQQDNFSYIGFQYYSLTWCCHRGQCPFTQQDRVDLVRAQFLRASTETNVADIAHCFMPDHVHQLVKGECTKLWLRKGFNRVLVDDFELRTTVKYIIENPVKAGLVTRVEDYPFTGSSKYTMKELMEMAYAV